MDKIAVLQARTLIGSGDGIHTYSFLEDPYVLKLCINVWWMCIRDRQKSSSD